MCGITGIFNLKGATGDIQGRIKKMTDTLAHRGPNSDGFFVANDSIALGHRRLSIIDLSTGANQPFADNSGRYIVVFNGEIYNYLDVKPLLSDYAFKTTSDTEVILAAYAKWGADCLKYLNGMFAFAIWDKEAETLFVARDRLGVKPFYYYFDGSVFVFASEIRSALSSGFIPKLLDRNALRDYLVFQSVYAPYTIVKNLFQLMPGTCGFVTKKEGFVQQTYWRIEQPTETFEITNPQDARKNVRDLMAASIERRLISDVPLGAFLSGGIDSSAIVGLMAEVSTQRIDTFTVVFDEKEFDESYYAGIVAKKFNTHHTKIRLTPDDFLKSLPDALNAVDAPSGDGFNTYIVSKATKEAGITVALSGLGGDELFAGYPYFRFYQSIRNAYPLYNLVPNSVKSALLSVAGKIKPPKQRWERIENIVTAKNASISNAYPYFRLTHTEEEADGLLQKNGFTDLIIRQLLNQRSKDVERLPILSQVTVAELLGYTLNVLLRDTDQFSMASALEVREPFFDYKLVEYVLQVPDNFKRDRTSPKNLLVSAVSPLLPDEIVHRPKMGFSFPWNQWLLNELRPLCEKNIDSLCRHPFFDSDALKAEWQLFIKSEGKSCSWVKIWQLVVLAHWLTINGFME